MVMDGHGVVTEPSQKRWKYCTIFKIFLSYFFSLNAKIKCNLANLHLILKILSPRRPNVDLDLKYVR